MKLAELKQRITENDCPTEFMIWQCSEKDNRFLAQQYISEICSQTGKVKNYISSLLEPSASATEFFFQSEAKLNILEVEEFSEFAEDYNEFENIIVICDKINKKIEQQVKDYVIKIPKYTDWAVKDFMRMQCPGLLDTDIDSLYTVTKGNIYRIVNELDKLAAFDESKQHEVLMELMLEDVSDLCTMEIFELADAIAKRDTARIEVWQRHKNNFDFDPIALTTLLLRTYKNITYLNFESGKTPEALGISKGAAWHLRQDYRVTSLPWLIKTIDFLSGIDVKLKENKLTMSGPTFINYLICHLYA